MTKAISVADRLAGFVCEQRRAGLPQAVLHDAKRLLLNQLMTSAAAASQPAGAALLQAARVPDATTGPARVWWTHALVPPAQAAAVNARLCGMVAFGDTHLPSLGRFTVGIVPMLLAQADAGGHAGHAGHAGHEVLEALALGLAVDVACAGAAELAPLGLGAAVARCTLLGLDRTALAASLARLGDAALLDEASISGGLPGFGESWHLHDIALHCRPLPVQALAPVDAVLALRSQGLLREPRLMQLGLSPQAWQLLQTQPPSAGDDLCRGMAVAWLLGQFSLDEQEPACLDSVAVRSLASRIALLPSAELSGIEACSLILQFADGTSERADVDGFLGSAGHPLSDSQLSELFRNAADDLVLPRRAGEILHALWGLDRAADSRTLTALLRRP